MNREDIYKAIDLERIYQNEKWGEIDKKGHEVGAWILLMRNILNRAEVAWCSNKGDVSALGEIRKLIATGVACAEQHGITERVRDAQY